MNETTKQKREDNGTKVRQKEQKETSNKQIVPSNEKTLTIIEQKIMSNKQEAKSKEQWAKSLASLNY